MSIQHPALMVAARPAVVRYTPDHSHGPSRCQESDRPTSVVYALLIYLPAGDSQKRRGDAMRNGPALSPHPVDLPRALPVISSPALAQLFRAHLTG